MPIKPTAVFTMLPGPYPYVPEDSLNIWRANDGKRVEILAEPSEPGDYNHEPDYMVRFEGEYVPYYVEPAELSDFQTEEIEEA